MAGWFVPGGKRSGILLRARSGIYLSPIALGSRLWKVNELRSPSLSSPFSLLLLLSRLQNCEQCNFFCQRLLAFGLPRGILCACTLSTTLLSNAFVIWHKSWGFFQRCNPNNLNDLLRFVMKPFDNISSTLSTLSTS